MRRGLFVGIAVLLAATWTAAGLYLGWLALQVLLKVIVPGPKVEGVPQPDGTRLSYRMNGHRRFLRKFLIFQ